MPEITPTLAPTPSVLPTTNANVQNFLQSYQPTAQQVYSPANVQQATTAPAAPPNLADPMGIYSYYMNTPEVTQAQKDYQALNQKLSQFDIGTQQANLGLENQPISLNVIRGEQAQLGQQAAVTRQGLASQALVAQSAMEAARQTAQDKLNLALSQRSELTNLITQFPGAKISYADTVDSAAKKINKYQEEQVKKTYKDNLKQTALQLGIKTKGTTKDIEKRLKKYYGDEAAYNKTVQQLEIAAKKKALVPAGSATGGALGNLKGSLTEAIYSGKISRDAAAATYQAQTGQSGNWVYQAAPDGYEKNIVAASQQKPITQAQYTVAGYANRADESSNIINGLEETGASKMGYITGSSWFPNLLKSTERQQLEQAQRDFVNAVLRRESGAAIAQSEFDNAAKQYFPQPGDSTEVIAQKKRNRDIVISNLKQASGAAYQGVQMGEQDINDIISQFGL